MVDQEKLSPTPLLKEQLSNGETPVSSKSNLGPNGYVTADKEESTDSKNKVSVRQHTTFSWKNVGSWDGEKSHDKIKTLSIMKKVESYVTDHFFGDWYWNTALLIGTCFFSWLIARVGGGILSLLFILLFTNSVYRLEFRRFNRDIRDDMTRVEAIKLLDKEYETMEWLNSFLDKFWVIYMPALSETVMYQANEVLKDQAPGFGIEKLSLDEFTLGSKAPRINSVKSYPYKGSDLIVMDWDFSFAPNDTDGMTKAELKKKINPKVALGVTIGKAFISKSLPILVEDMSFTGRMNIKLKLSENFPHVKIVSVQFLEPPTIDYGLKPVGGDTLGIDIMSFIPGLSSFVNGLIHSNLRPMLYAPNSLDIDVEEIIASLTNDSNGVIAVTVKRLIDLKTTEEEGDEPKKLNPYVQLKLSSNGSISEDTTVKEDTDNPVYLETKYILVKDLDGNQLSFFVYDLVKDQINDNLIGNVDFQLGDLLQKSTQIGVVKNLSESGKVVGKIEFDLRYFPSLEPMVLDDGSKVPVTDTEVGIMKLTLNGARDLDLSESVYGLLNPYAEIYVNGQLTKTCRTLRQNNEPSWNQGFEALITQQSKTHIEVLIRDAVESNVVAKLDSNLQDLVFETNRGQQWIKTPSVVEGGRQSKFKISATWKALSLEEDKAVKSYSSAPIGGLRIHLRHAKNVKNLEAVGNVDPYVRILINGKITGRTKTVSNTLDPNFNDVAFISVANSHQHVLLEIMDEEEDKDRSLGTAAISVNEFLKKNLSGYYMGYDGSEEVLEQPILYNGASQGSLFYSVSFIPALPVYTISELENKDAVREDIARHEKEHEIQYRNSEKLYKENPNEYEWINVGDKAIEPQKIELPLAKAIKYRTGNASIHVLSGKFDKPNLLVQILFDDHAYPSGISSKADGKLLSTPFKAEGFIRDLPNSKMILRLAKKVEVNHEKDIVVEKTFDTIELLKRANEQPIPVKINEKNQVQLQMEFFPSPSKLAPSDTILDVGHMKLDILSAENLNSVDSNGMSDPFASISLDGVELYKTNKRRKTLDPVWDESLDFPMLSRSRQILLLEVYDWDLTHAPELLGRANLDLSTIEPFDSIQFKVKLDTRGIVTLRATFRPEYIRPVLGSSLGLPDIGAMAGAGGKVLAGAGGAASGLAGAGAGAASEKGSSFIKGLGRRKRKNKDGVEEEVSSPENSSLYSGKTANTGRSPRKSKTTNRDEDIDEEEDEENGEDGEEEDKAEGKDGVQEQNLGMESVKSKHHEIHAAPNVNANDLPPPQRPFIPTHDRTISSANASTYSSGESGSGGIPGRVGIIAGSGFDLSSLEVKVLVKAFNNEKGVFKTRSSRPNSSGIFKWNESSPFKAPTSSSLEFIVREHHTFGKNVELGRAALPLADVLDNQENVKLPVGGGELDVVVRYIAEMAE